jgi:hypothetical protein
MPCRDSFSRQARQRPLGGIASHGGGICQSIRTAITGVPIITLHRLATTGNGRNGQTVSRIRIAIQKSTCITEDKMPFVGINARPLGIGNALIGRQCGTLGLDSESCGFFDT